MSPTDAESAFLKLLEQEELAAEALDPWEGWKAFKAFLHLPVDDVYDAASVQGPQSVPDEPLPPEAPNSASLYFIRQFSRWDHDSDVGIQRVVVELEFDPKQLRRAPPIEVWTHDFPTLSDFASVVESHPCFQAAVNTPPVRTSVYSEHI